MIRIGQMTKCKSCRHFSNIQQMQTLSRLYNEFYVTRMCIIIRNVVTICIISFYMTRHMYISFVVHSPSEHVFHVIFIQSNVMKISQNIF